MTEAELLAKIETRAKKKGAELLAEVLDMRRSSFEVNSDLSQEGIEAQADRMLMGVFDQLESLKGMV